MTRFLADEDFNNDILRGLLRRLVHLNVVRVQDIGLRGADDDTVLAAETQRSRHSRRAAASRGAAMALLFCA